MNNINNSSRKKGYALSMLMIALLVISLGIVALIPVLSMKKDTFTNTSAYVKKCIVDESAANMSTTACLGAKVGLTKGFDKDYNSVLYYLNNATYTTAALNVVKAACDQDGSKACNILLDRCASNSDSFPNTCNIATSENDLYYYISMASSVGKDYIKTKGVEYYLQGMPNFKNAVDAACNADMASTACDIAGETKTRIYNFNSPQRSDFFESNSTTGTKFHDGVVDLVPGTLVGGASGKAYSWGRNDEGELGDTTTTGRLVPTAVYTDGLPATYSQISVGPYHSCGISSDTGTLGKAYCWGANSNGQLGDTTTTGRLVPTAVYTTGLPATYSQISAGFSHSCEISADAGTLGKAYCWGHNDCGELGNNRPNGGADKKTPQAVYTDGLPATYSQISSGDNFTCGISADAGTLGKAYCWGYNNYGQLGDNTNAQKNIPTAVYTAGLPATYSKISSGSYHSCGISADAGTLGKAYCWGDNTYEQLGDNTTTARLVPTAVYTTGLPATYSKISSGSYHSCGISANAGTLGKAYCWGNNTAGSLGDSTTTARLVPTAVYTTGLPATYSQISAGNNFTCGISADAGTLGKAYCWGTDNSGQIGDNATNTARLVPTAVYTTGLPATYSQISTGNFFTCVISADAGSAKNTAYITTLNNNQITNIIGGIKSCSITATPEATQTTDGTKIRGLVSFNGRNSWLKCTANCDDPATRTWGTVASGCDPTTNSCLNNTLISTNGNTITEMQQELANLTIGTITGQTGKLDFAFYMETDTTGLITPFIDTVSITFLKGR